MKVKYRLVDETKKTTHIMMVKTRNHCKTLHFNSQCDTWTLKKPDQRANSATASTALLFTSVHGFGGCGEKRAICSHSPFSTKEDHGAVCG
ncbi:hypothetical protein BaRGS_00013805 [Batillaria attramentaria]|uniref:Uncharacterized protein n=1 Tax=Batillaria attramentaria TaxID=370345 RepID=A0ABD0L6M1_9CAEN